MVYAILSIPSTSDYEASLKTKVIVLSAPDELSAHVVKQARDKVNKASAFLEDGNRLSFSGVHVDVHIIIEMVESGGYKLKSVSTEKQKTLFVFEKA